MSPEQEALAVEDALIRRLHSMAEIGKRCIGVVAPERRAAALRLQTKGLVRTWPGTGLDEGVLLVEEIRTRPGGAPSGGAAA